MKFHHLHHQHQLPYTNNLVSVPTRTHPKFHQNQFEIIEANNPPYFSLQFQHYFRKIKCRSFIDRGSSWSPWHNALSCA